MKVHSRLLIYLIFTVLLGGQWSTTPAWAEKKPYRCSQYLKQKLSASDSQVTTEGLDQVFQKAFHRSAIYECYSCHQNVIRLFRAFQKKYPQIKASDFKVLYIATTNLTQNLNTNATFKVNLGRGGFMNGQRVKYVEWRLHVILEHQGRIYDLDYTDKPTPVNKAEYYDSFFTTQNLWSENVKRRLGRLPKLLVYAIPGEWYLDTDSFTADTDEFHQAIFDTFEGQELEDYFR